MDDIKLGGCSLSDFERRLYCARKRAGKFCLNPSFLGHRCPYLKWSKEEVIMEAQKGTKEIRAKSAISQDAIEYAEKFRPELRLVQNGKVVKPRRRRAKVAAVS